MQILINVSPDFISHRSVGACERCVQEGGKEEKEEEEEEGKKK
jgi:hypothetical protein